MSGAATAVNESHRSLVMKKYGVLLCVAAMGLGLVGCKEEKAESSMGAVGTKAECTDKSAGCTEEKAGSMGAVSEKKDGCCPSKAKTEGSMGAVSEKSDCSAAKTGCSDAKQN
jgi:hypothetical protein